MPHRLLRALLPLLLCATAHGVWAQDTAAPAENIVLRLLREEALAYENGEGVARDGPRAAALYCKAARLGDAQSQYNLGWMYSHGRGVDRSDSVAAFFFHAAAEQGLPQAVRMLKTVGGPSDDTPECMRDPLPAPVVAVKPGLGRSAGKLGSTYASDAQALEALVPQAPRHLVALATRTASEHKVAPELVLAIMEAESNFNVAALSPRNAQGLMQLMPDTAARFNVARPYDPAQNIRGGVAYLRWLLAYFEGDVALVAAAYNAGEGTVNRYRGVPPYAETLGYVSRVLRKVGSTELAFDRSAAEASPQLRQIQALRYRR